MMRLILCVALCLTPNVVMACALAVALPECQQTIHQGQGDIRSAYYAQPTGRYGHGILGDAIEAGSLVVLDRVGHRHEIDLPQNEVFEDIAPRLHDLDRDGTVEVITIRASLTKGAAVTIYGMDNGALVQKASTRFHGKRNRWLNIAGFGNLSGGGLDHIYFVRTPHIGGTLYEYRYQHGRLRRLAKLSGFSNHKIGSRHLKLSAFLDRDPDQPAALIVPDNDRRSLKIIEAHDQRMQVVDDIELSAEISHVSQVTFANGRHQVRVVLRDGSRFQFER